eukprot:TRINITY_DN7633_c0_g1_i3.p1 TRINITY_DN7633_c0_g1~~TRINITY_DN7633_c0_g1_i3.p1  ORF type:complete len:214 (+),score=90.12 TRINITY_DN7633_c0_g1_i3:188-829(+)
MISVTAEEVEIVMKKFLEEKSKKIPRNSEPKRAIPNLPVQHDVPMLKMQPSAHASADRSMKEEVSSDDEDGDDPSSHAASAVQDPGVSDAIWREIQQAKLRWEKQQRDMEEQCLKLEQDRIRMEDHLKDLEAQCQRETDAALKKQMEDDRKKRMLQLRQMIIKENSEKTKMRKQKEEEEKRQREFEGLCPANYRWYQVEGGWRCEGGSHFRSS